MTRDQLQRVAFFNEATGRQSHPDNSRHRLDRLVEGSYLQKTALTLSPERIFFLGPKAAGVLRKVVGLPCGRAPKLSDTSGHVLHEVLISECAVRFWEARRLVPAIGFGRLAPWGLPFYGTHSVETAVPAVPTTWFVTREDVSASGRTWNIRPDLTFGLAEPGRTRLFYLEADRATERPVEIAAKLEGYGFFRTAAPERWQRLSEGVDKFRVLVVTTEEAHAVRILHVRRQLDLRFADN